MSQARDRSHIHNAPPFPPKTNISINSHQAAKTHLAKTTSSGAQVACIKAPLILGIGGPCASTRQTETNTIQGGKGSLHLSVRVRRVPKRIVTSISVLQLSVYTGKYL